MLQFLSLVLFSAVIVISLAAIVATIKAELPHILRALGIDPAPLPPLNTTREPRVRVIRQAKLTPRASLRAAA